MANPRKLAVSALLRCESGGYSNIVLNSSIIGADGSSEDMALVTALFYGVLERKITIDAILNRYLKKPIKKTPPYTSAVLRVGLYQLLYMNKIPPSAAVNEAVKLIKASKEKNNAPLVNAVLRRAASFDLTELEKGEDTASLSVRFSCNEWIVETLIDALGKQDAICFLEDSLKPPPLYIRVNTEKTTVNELIEQLKVTGIIAELCSVPGALKITGLKNIEKNELYLAGYFHVQDLSSQACAAALQAEKGQRVLDLCAAPGGKSFTVAELMQDSGELLSCDVWEHRVGLIQSGARRLGLNCITPYINDAGIHNEKLGLFDRVLCDVPCTGLGIIRRKPEIKYKEEAEAESVVPIQQKILCIAAGYVKVGGRLIYSTCTLNIKENQDVVNHFLKTHPDFGLVSVGLDDGTCGYTTLVPKRDESDGFFIAAIGKLR